MIASDGWDSDPPEELRAVMARLRAPGPAGGVAQPARRRRRVRAPGRVDGRGPALLRRLPARAHGRGAARGLRCRQLHKVTCTAGRNRPTSAPSPRTIAWVARGVRDEPDQLRTGRDLAGRRAASRSAHDAAARQLAVRRCGTSRPVAQVVPDREADGEGEPDAAAGLGERGGVALEDPLPLSGTASRRSTVEVSPAESAAPGPRCQTLVGELVAGSTVPAATGCSGRGHDQHVVVQERLLHDGPGGVRLTAGPSVTSTAREASRPAKSETGCTLSSTSRSRARLVNRLIRPGCGVLGEQAPTRPAAASDARCPPR